MLKLGGKKNKYKFKSYITLFFFRKEIIKIEKKTITFKCINIV